MFEPLTRTEDCFPPISAPKARAPPCAEDAEVAVGGARQGSAPRSSPLGSCTSTRRARPPQHTARPHGPHIPTGPTVSGSLPGDSCPPADTLAPAAWVTHPFCSGLRSGLRVSFLPGLLPFLQSSLSCVVQAQTSCLPLLCPRHQKSMLCEADLQQSPGQQLAGTA